MCDQFVNPYCRWITSCTVAAHATFILGRIVSMIVNMTIRKGFSRIVIVTVALVRVSVLRCHVKDLDVYRMSGEIGEVFADGQSRDCVANVEKSADGGIGLILDPNEGVGRIEIGRSVVMQHFADVQDAGLEAIVLLTADGWLFSADISSQENVTQDKSGYFCGQALEQRQRYSVDLLRGSRQLLFKCQ